MIDLLKLFRLLAVGVSVLFLAACSPKQVVQPSPVLSSVEPEVPDSVSYAEAALKEKVSDSIAIRPSWTYYQYALQAMDNQEWLLARHYLDESLRQLVSEKYDSLYRNVSAAEDSAYRSVMPLRIVRALDEVYPNVADISVDAESFKQNDVSIEGIDALDESDVDSAALQVIENFLDTVDVKQFTLPVEFNERVMQEIYYMTNGARKFTEGSLNRKTAYDSLIYAKLEEMGMPKDLIYLALVESGFKVKAYSRAKASGMWQFIPETGKRYGLEVDYWVDMRRNPEMATVAALKYLKRLHDEFGDWLLAMASYNCGEGRVRRLVKEMMVDSTRDTTKVVTYWDLALPKETMRYVPRILAAMVIGHFPEHYDMKVEKQSLPDFDTVTVFDSFPLEEVAKLLKVPEDTLRTLNMELVKWCTPPNKDSYLLRLPVGTRSAFVEGYDKMEKNNFSSWHHHKVKRGETLGVIARSYGISITELKQANDMKNDRIRAGKSLLIPIKVKPKKSTGKKPTKVKTYVVKLGDNLGSIARLFGVSQEALRTWNSMDAAALVKQGDTIFVSKPELKPAEEAAQVERPALKKGEKYAVKAGDTYAAIAKAYSVPVVLLLEANNGFTKRLSVGDSLVIPEFVQAKKKPVAKSEGVKKAEPAPQCSGDTYTVQSGDNLFGISKKCGTTIADIQTLNNMGESTSIYPGQKLKVAGKAATKAAPAPATKADDGFVIHEVTKGEGLWDIARQYKVTIEDIVKWNGLSDTKIKIGDKLKIKKN
ncbi:MAG: LysM peptidoglycan-binding domain-containing protein [Fibrobacter sp.]|nr:LysM peptidoglycan-binding domain-containing protein [Fibrobacter sp.]